MNSELIKLLKEHINSNANVFICSKDQTYIDATNQTIQETQFLDKVFNKVPFKLRMYHLINNIQSIPQCSKCNKHTTYKKDKIHMDNPYTLYCSSECRAGAKGLKLDKILTKEYLIKQHHELKKPLVLIGKELGVSHVPIRKRLREFDIEIFDYKKANENINKVYDNIEGELEIQQYIESLLNYNLEKDKELDIVVPEYNLAIEYNGLPWHTQYFGKKDKNYHLNKTTQCLNKDYTLLHFYSTEWLNKQSIVKSMIASRLGFGEKIYARKCKLVVVDKTDANYFYDQNHLQGKGTNEFICIGLEYDNELVSCMSFAKSRFNKNYDYELVRYANKKFTNVVGGASRILKRFRKEFKGSIISYADRRYSEGGLYHTLGFKLISTNKPTYSYYKNGELFNRTLFKKTKLKTMFNDFDEELTEQQNMLNQGYDIVWNCGTYSFVL